MTPDTGRNPGTRTLLVRYSGDISTKAHATRQRFTKRLARNIKDAVRSMDTGCEVRREWDRIYLDVSGPLALDAVARVFGVQSVSPVERRPWTSLDDVVAAGEELFRDAVAGKTFAVRARRGGGDVRSIPFNSLDIDRALGTALLGYSNGVDLAQPEVTVQIEIHPDGAYYFLDVIPSHGGLPIGVEGRALSLVSGGFDSAVASWMMLRRGVSLDYFFCNLGGPAHREGVLRVMRVVADLWSYGDRPRLFEVDFAPVVRNLQERVAPRYWQIVLKRLMLRAAEPVAREVGAWGLVTGEAVGQVSSQTLPNLAAISGAVRGLVMRPLIGSNKEEIVEMARRIGTYRLSASVEEYCALAARNPATAASIEAVEAEERKLDPGILDAAVAGRAVHNLRELGPEALERELEVDDIPEGAMVLDLRSKTAWQSWHPEGALHLDYLQALKAYRLFDRSHTYVAYCEVGYKSAHLAVLMREAGFRAFHLRDGVRKLVKRARTEGSVA